MVRRRNHALRPAHATVHDINLTKDGGERIAGTLGTDVPGQWSGPDRADVWKLRGPCWVRADRGRVTVFLGVTATCTDVQPTTTQTAVAGGTRRRKLARAPNGGSSSPCPLGRTLPTRHSLAVRTQDRPPTPTRVSGPRQPSTTSAHRPPNPPAPRSPCARAEAQAGVQTWRSRPGSPADAADLVRTSYVVKPAPAFAAGVE